MKALIEVLTLLGIEVDHTQPNYTVVRANSIKDEAMIIDLCRYLGIKYYNPRQIMSEYAELITIYTPISNTENKQ